MAHILVVEDDPDIASLLSRGLGAAGHRVDWADTVEAAADRIAAASFDAAIIDMMLGDDSGASLLADLRAQGNRMPAIMLSALARVEDRAEGLEAGAQDYVVKPFQLSELLARLEVQLHRAAPRQGPIALGRLVYDPDTRTASALGGTGRAVVMTEREGELLAYLMARPGQVLTRGELFDALWAQHGGSTDNVVDVYLGYIRRKLDNFTPYGLALRTLRRRGFVLTQEISE
ncbi:DNA-binding response regulator [Paracoccus yeei]|jgi:DNA-binding response OmpR family regulator|uniref:DNA-binding response regulator n=2 Tax=Paracoccus TaxID=265 RepID=A0A1V0GRW5_9RHOB|nr:MULTISPECIES: response regulator transcription factor [Paracoccus]ARC36439.1 DNA-binding response regulator [Paracoccus yeei]ATQ55013.1 DNA-binding response regulator [Paracoccus yeei]AWX92950.1 DNA-binding response regulator [Paracoccus mutanolyticus]QEU07454.1 response regulator transcription factor [Paracoccus yeei]